ncbi:MAG: hypothetical protein JSW71_10350 [Gemmatimonadota bacterium]|nr:MAG: hypothetical protein JSW71_10350 [Gemmatimonadota bacterium]
MRVSLPRLVQCVLFWSLVFCTDAAAQDQAVPIASQMLRELRFRTIGPAVTGGRIHDVEALPDDPSTIYLATASGGIWKSTNKGTTWTSLFDNHAVSTFGDVAIAPSNSQIVWAGTGEQNNRQSTSWGNGVYRSVDGGTTWAHLGLDETRHIGEVVVHPENPDVAYVAALGSLWAASDSRGVFKTTDGGQNWSRVLFVDQHTGVVEMVMDPSDPSTLYAATYQRLRRAWGFNGGGPGSSIYKTSDGGATWRELANGLPQGDKGRIGLAIAKTDALVLNATIEHATESGVYRTEDGGETWEKVNSLNPRPMYYSHIYIDPTNANRIYILATSFYKSEDGGRSFETLPTRPTYDVGVHSDFHDLWIDPNNSNHFYLVGDAGLHESWDMGQTHMRIRNLPIGQFYGIGVDMRDPYWVYGGMQDNHSWMGPSATRHWVGILNDDWRQIGFGDGMYQQPDPSSHRYVYVLAQNGSILRLDAETGDALDVRPLPPAGEPDYRYDWVTPALVSRHDPSSVYLGGNRLFISRDRGVSWERTEDLTRQIDRRELELMGVKGYEQMLSANDGTSYFGEITTIAESPLDPAIIWAGTDDGNVQVSIDGGSSWSEVSGNVPDVPDGTYVSRVTASASVAGAAYVAFDAHRDGDFKPYLFHTTDFGNSWTPIASDLPSGSVNVIVEHAVNPDVLFVGTEHALFVSTDAGGHWAKFDKLPTTLFDDLVIHPRDNDLIVGTHGRSILILDDLTPITDWSAANRGATAHLFPIRRATIFQYWKDTSYRADAEYAGTNPPFGAILTYLLKEDVDAATVSVTNGRGEVVREYNVPGDAGMHRTTWDLRYEPAPGGGFGQASPADLPQPVGARGPFVAPGTFTITLTAGAVQSTQSLTVLGDPLMQLTQEQWDEREAFLVTLLHTQRTLQETARSVSQLRRTLAAQRDSLGDAAPARLVQQADSAQALERSLRTLSRSAGSLAGAFNGQGVRQGSLYPPTETHRERMRRLESGLEQVMAALREMEGR